ncbi:GntR family transcriptional regulator [Shimwellia pseudoproteus]|uniref:GntR family transcriptional regulator n=1 Tax=Shimwellia pseudoproteus TaxID=570012 RepID=UPI0018EC187B|nr:GntR family transcriptional regulator [Shimwellia pseudoproteus]MBJ3813695.1 GntR family transcriptional regulator [Shimwellia pseudoproteus]
MSRPQHLRHSVINQFLDSIARGHLTSPLPSQHALAEAFNISRTTVRHILTHLVAEQILSQQGRQFLIRRIPSASTEARIQTLPDDAQYQHVEQAFYRMINQRVLRPGARFTELALARETGATPQIVREFLLRFSRYALIEHEQRGSWRMKTFDRQWAEQLFELRALLETHALGKFMALGADDPRWLQARDLLARHRQLRNSIGSDYRLFSELDQGFHALLLSAAQNLFFNQSLEIISVIFHFHYQWDERDLQQRNIVSVDQHMMILNAMLAGQREQAVSLLHYHLDTAKQAMITALVVNQQPDASRTT